MGGRGRTGQKRDTRKKTSNFYVSNKRFLKIGSQTERTLAAGGAGGGGISAPPKGEGFSGGGRVVSQERDKQIRKKKKRGGWAKAKRGPGPLLPVPWEEGTGGSLRKKGKKKIRRKKKIACLGVFTAQAI